MSFLTIEPTCSIISRPTICCAARNAVTRRLRRRVPGLRVLTSSVTCNRAAGVKQVRNSAPAPRRGIDSQQSRGARGLEEQFGRLVRCSSVRRRRPSGCRLRGGFKVLEDLHGFIRIGVLCAHEPRGAYAPMGIRARSGRPMRRRTSRKMWPLHSRYRPKIGVPGPVLSMKAGPQRHPRSRPVRDDQ